MFHENAVLVDINGKHGRGSVRFLDGYDNRAVRCRYLVEVTSAV